MKHTVLILLFLTIQASAQKITIYGIGDSTMADKVNPDQNPEYGWLQVFPRFLTDEVKVINKAVNGRSTKSFINEGRWDSIYKVLKPGNYVFIEFGHNDEKTEDPARYTNPHTGYRYNLIRFINESRQKGALPVLFSSIARRNFNEKGVLIPTHGAYTQEARLVAAEMKVPFIDLEYHTEVLEELYGPEKSKELHLHYQKGEHPYYPEGKADDTHLSSKGATEISKIVVVELKQLMPSFKKYFKN